MQLPTRREHLTSRSVGDELVVYDVAQARAHRLNRTTALVWRHCDGHTTVPELAALIARELGIPANEDVVWMALDQLDRAKLLKSPLARSSDERAMSRRQAIALGLVGALAALLPGCDSATMPASLKPNASSRDVGSSSPLHPPHSPPPPPHSPPPPPPPPPPPGECVPSMTLAPITLGGCTVECHIEHTPHKDIAVFDAQTCEFRGGFLVTGEPKCEGRCDSPAGKCTTKVSFSWAIVKQDPADSATIQGSSTNKNVKVRGTKQLGKYTLELTVTLQCRCGDKDNGAPLVRTTQHTHQVNQNCH